MNNEDLKALRVMIAAQKRVIGDIYVLQSEIKIKMHNLCDNHVDLLHHSRLYEFHQHHIENLLDKMGIKDDVTEPSKIDDVDKLIHQAIRGKSEKRILADISLLDEMIKEGWEPVPVEDE